MSRRLPWVKLHRAILTDEAALELSAHALLLRVVCEASAFEAEGHEIGEKPAPAGIGWVVREDGRPYTVRTLSRLTHLSEDEVRAAIRELVDERLMINADDDCLGVLGFGPRQVWVAPATKRKRRERARRRDESRDESQDVTVTVTVADRDMSRDGHATVTTREEEDQTKSRPDEDPEQTKTQTRREQSPELALVPSGPDPVDEVAKVYAEARKALGLGAARSPTSKRLTTIRKRGPATVTVTIRRAAESLRREVERGGLPDAKGLRSAEFFTLASLLRPATIERYGEQPDLDQRLPAKPRAGAWRQGNRPPPRAPVNLNDDEGEL